LYESVTQYNLYKVRINIGSISEYNLRFKLDLDSSQSCLCKRAY